jgi:hypothetical protein
MIKRLRNCKQSVRNEALEYFLARAWEVSLANLNAIDDLQAVMDRYKEKYYREDFSEETRSDLFGPIQSALDTLRAAEAWKNKHPGEGK